MTLPTCSLGTDSFVLSLPSSPLWCFDAAGSLGKLAASH